MKKFLNAYENRITKYQRHLAAENEYLAAVKRSNDTPVQLHIHQAEIRRLTDLIELCRLICEDINEFENEVNEK